MEKANFYLSSILYIYYMYRVERKLLNDINLPLYITGAFITLLSSKLFT